MTHGKVTAEVLQKAFGEPLLAALSKHNSNHSESAIAERKYSEEELSESIPLCGTETIPGELQVRRTGTVWLGFALNAMQEKTKTRRRESIRQWAVKTNNVVYKERNIAVLSCVM